MAPPSRSLDERLGMGYVVVDKPSGPTSHVVTSWVGDLLGVDRVAHTGTLDPGVTGCLPVLLGRAARLSGVLSSMKKEYVSVLRLHGEVRDLDSVLDSFRGEIYQRPPRHSAVNRVTRRRVVHELELLERSGSRSLLRIKCEAGLYIRKLCHDIGLVAGVGGHMEELRRTRSGGFRVEGSVYLQEIMDAYSEYSESGDEEWIRDVVKPIEVGVDGYSSVVIRDSAVDAVAHGAPIYEVGVVEIDAGEGSDVFVYSESGELVCVGELVLKDDVVAEPFTVLIEPGEYPDSWR